MKTFKDLEFHEDDMDGVAAWLLFDNHFGVSVIKGPYSQGGDKGLYELAVIYMSPDMKESKIHYDNEVAQGDVCGYLTEDEVSELIEQVQNF
jgi:hypothetical protein